MLRHFGKKSPKRNPEKLVKNLQIHSGARRTLSYDSAR